jgi:glycosyltransferase involved in cell wall biosynthesis
MSSVSTPTLPQPYIAIDGEPEISVIIPVLNGESVIGRCLECLVQNRFSRNRFEIIVVDNGSKDRTLDVAKSFQAQVALRILVLEKVHISALRNLGATEAHGKVLAFLDADCLAPPDWLHAVSQIARKDNSGVCGAHYQIPDDATWVGRVWSNDILHRKQSNVSYVPAGDLIMRQDAFKRVGGFDESIQTNEDFELCQRAIQSGLTVGCYPELAVVHLGTPRTLLGFFRKQRWHGTHVLLVFLRDPRKGNNRRVVLLSVYTLLCLLGMLAGMAFAIAQRGWMILALFVVLLVLPMFLIAAYRSMRRGRWLDIPALTFLYLTFCVARASSLMNF